MIFKSELISAASGPIGGVSYSHGRGGLQRQKRIQRADKSTNLQQTVRARFTELTQAWSTILTQAQRDGWSNYATQTPIAGKLGDPTTLPGAQMYMRCNGVRLAANAARIDEAPTKPGTIMMGRVFPIASTEKDFFRISTTGDSEWREIDGGLLLIKNSRILPLSRRYQSQSLRVANVALGSTASPQVVFTWFDNGFGQSPADYTGNGRVAFEFVASAPDGRISNTRRQIVTMIS